MPKIPSSSGEYSVDPVLAESILNSMPDWQRRSIPHHRASIALAIKEGKKFLEAIIVGIWDGVPHLLDGQHRLGGLVDTGMTAKFQFVVHRFGSEAEAFTAFIDLGAGRPRTSADAIKPNELAAFSLSHAQAKAIVAAGLMIENNFIPFSGRQNGHEVRRVYDRFAEAGSLFYGRVMGPGSFKSFSRRPVMAVVLPTLADPAMRGEAIEFWHTAAHGLSLDGVENDLCKAVCNHATCTGKVDSVQLFSVVIKHWEAKRRSCSPRHAAIKLRSSDAVVLADVDPGYYGRSMRSLSSATVTPIRAVAP